jgi:hypothetical protein
MSNTIDQPGPFDAIAKARPGEPIFTLLGRDPCAPECVLQWARANRERVLRADPALADDKRMAELLQSAEAEEIAFNMDEYRKGFVPVEAETEKVGYGGYRPGAEMLKAIDRDDKLTAASRALAEADAQIVNALELLATVEDAPALGYPLAKMSEQLQAASSELSPRRVIVRGEVPCA